MLNPTLACANRLNLGSEIQLLEQLGVPMFHLDIMDGHYVPNLCFDIDTIAQIGKVTQVPLDVHLMVENPSEYIERLAPICPKYISFHFDQSNTPFRMIKLIKESGAKAGIVLNPKEQPDIIQPLLNEVELVTVMGVEPGFSGQKFMPETIRKITRLVELRQQLNANFLISVDGGIDIEAGEACLKVGADVLVVGALAIFNQSQSVEELYQTFVALEKTIEKRKQVEK